MSVPRLYWFRYDRSSTIILFTLIIVLVIDYASTKLREQLL
jgi:phosphonate transport system permease protein